MKLGFAGGSISDYDWDGMLPCLKGVKTMLEFGAGYSTILFRDEGIKVTTVETSLEWKQKVLDECPEADIYLWDNQNVELPSIKYDIAFVDGEDPRDMQFVLATQYTDKIIVHDGGRPYIMKLVDKYLNCWEEIPITGRSRFFIRKNTAFKTPIKVLQKEGVKNNYAAITSCTDNYIQYLNALLNSMDAQKVILDMHVVAIDVNEEYLKQIEEADWCFNLILHRFTEKEIHDEIGECKRFDAQLIRYRIDETLYSKKSRYHTLTQIYSEYEVVMMLDADMMVVRDIMPFFDMVSGTDIILGVNERFCWPLNSFELDGETLPEIPMHWMMCNAPLWFSPPRHKKLIKEIDYCARNLRQNKSVVSDLFSMNVGIWRAGVTDRVVQLPFHCWTGTHNGYIQFFTHAQKIKDEWISIMGDPIYMLHGRWDGQAPERGFIMEQHKRWNEIELSDRLRKVDEDRFKKIFTLIKKEFVHYNSECKVQLESITDLPK